jgi:hypothetical protein
MARFVSIPRDDFIDRDSDRYPFPPMINAFYLCIHELQSTDTIYAEYVFIDLN